MSLLLVGRQFSMGHLCFCSTSDSLNSELSIQVHSLILEDRDSVSLKDRGHICLLYRIIKVMFLPRGKFVQVCKQHPCMISGFLRSWFLSCDVNPLCVWILLWDLKNKENGWEHKDYAAYCAMSNEILGFWPRSLMSFFNIHEISSLTY